MKSWHMEDKSPLKWRGHGHVTHFNFLGPNEISGTAEARVVKFCTQVDYTIPNEISGTAEARVVKFCTQVDYTIFLLKDDKSSVIRELSRS